MNIKTINLLELGYGVGDQLWDSLENTWKTIREVDTNQPYMPILLDSGAKISVSGKASQGHINPRYLPNKFDIPNSAFERPLPELEIDAPVWVRDENDTRWLPRNFARWERRQIGCWQDGCTKHTADGLIRYWDEFRLANPKDDEIK